MWLHAGTVKRQINRQSGVRKKAKEPTVDHTAFILFCKAFYELT